MVYRLYRANRFLMTRIFIVLIIYSLIIGAIGITLLGIVVNFDAQSFNPQLYNANAPNVGIKPKAGLICDHYQSENCTWYLLNDLSRDQNFYKFKSFISDIENRTKTGNLLVLQDSTNKSSIVEAQVQLDPQTFTNSTNVILSSGTNTINELCVSLYDGRSCSATTPTDNFYFISNLNLYSDYHYSNFLGSQVLLTNDSVTNQPYILCSSQKGCPYSNIGNFKYKNIKTQAIVMAYQAIIKPNTNVTEVGNLQDVNRNGLVKMVCVYETENISNSCSNAGLYQPFPDYFVFLDGTNNIRLGRLSLNFLVSKNDVFAFKTSTSNLTCSQANQYSPFSINSSIPISCNPTTSENTIGVTYTYIPSPLNQKTNSNSPKLVFNIDSNNIQIMIALIVSSTQGKSTPAILLNIFSRPNIIYQSLLRLELARQILTVVVIFFIVNIVLAFLMIIFRFWKHFGGFIAPKSTMIFQGKIGHLLELTQFFQFGGSWYLEAQSVNDYNFKTTMGVVHELLRKRWRDTIFFPTSLAATISIFIFSIYSNAISIESLFVLGGILPFLLAFWIPALWVIEDSGLKRAHWSNNGELLTIQKISDIIRDGFNKLVGFGAIFGVGTAGATIARSILTGSSISSTAAISGGLESILSLNFNFLVSAVLWTSAFLFIVTAVSLTGNVITALSYLNTDHLGNVKKMRTTLQQKEIFLGTTQQSMEHGSFDTSVYFDSKKGIDSAMIQPTSSRHIQQMPLNQIIIPSIVASEEELTQIIITNPSKVDVEVKALNDNLKPVSQRNIELMEESKDISSESVDSTDQKQVQQESKPHSESQELEKSKKDSNESTTSDDITDEKSTDSSTDTDSQQ